MHFSFYLCCTLLGSNNDKQTVIYELIDHCTLHNCKIFKFFSSCPLQDARKKRKIKEKPIKTQSH